MLAIPCHGSSVELRALQSYGSGDFSHCPGVAICGNDRVGYSLQMGHREESALSRARLPIMF